jgi:hypothetical protein
MSKVSNTARYVQLKEWLESRGTKASTGRKQTKRFSKSDYYNKTR